MLRGAISAGRGNKARETATVTVLKSMTLELFHQSMDQNGQAAILDLGPICGENINHLAMKVKRLYVCDVYNGIHRRLKQDQPLDDEWKQLDFADNSLDGILAWDLVDHLPDEQVLHLAKRCKYMVRPGGLVAIMAHSEKSLLEGINAYVISGGNRLTPKLQPDVNLPVFIRQNRQVLKLMLPFTPVKSFVYRNGMREFLFRRP